MNPLQATPVAERPLPERHHATIRGMLMAELAAARPPARPALLTRRRLLVAMAVAGLLAAQFWPLPGQTRFLAWTLAPGGADGVTLADIEAKCMRSAQDTASRFPGEGAPFGFRPPAQGWEVMVLDRRGDTAAVLMTSADYFYFCDFGDMRQDPVYGLQSHGGGGFGRLDPRPPGQVIHTAGGFSAVSRNDLDPTGLTWYDSGFGSTFGQVAPEVTRVELTLSNGSEVEASVANGFFAAVWPGDTTRILLWGTVDVPDMREVRAHDASGHVIGEVLCEPVCRERPD